MNTENMSKIEDLEKKIKFWKERLNRTNNASNAAILSDKISSARKEIKKLSMQEQEKKITQHIDAPAMIDEINPVTLERGQVMGTGEVYIMEL
jgi:hypothetical protein